MSSVVEITELSELLSVDPTAMTGTELSTWLAAADAARSALEAKMLAVVARWDAAGQAQVEGVRSSATWLAQHCDMRRATACALVRDARKLREVPDGAQACATLGTTKVRTILGFVNDRTKVVFEEHQGLLFEQAEQLSVDDTVVMMRFWAMHADPDGSDPADPTGNEVHLTQLPNGRWDLRGNLDGVLGAALSKELEARAKRIAQARTKAGDGPLPNHSRLVADALETLLADATCGDVDGKVPAQPSVTAIVDFEFLMDMVRERTGEAHCHIAGTDPIRGETARRLACDAGINRMITKGKSIVLDAGRTVRTVTPAQRKAMRDRSPTCEFGDCDMPERWSQAHHINWWGRDGGRTDIDELMWVCTWHHYMVHELGWIVRRLDDGSVEVRYPNGTVFQGSGSRLRSA